VQSMLVAASGVKPARPSAVNPPSA
jgi:hypothetical protein